MSPLCFNIQYKQCVRSKGMSAEAGWTVACAQSYPEYCRQLLYASPSAEFLEALAEWERAYGKVRHMQPHHGDRSRTGISGALNRMGKCVDSGGPAAVCAAVLVHGRGGGRSGLQQERHVLSPQAPSHVRSCALSSP